MFLGGDPRQASRRQTPHPPPFSTSSGIPVPDSWGDSGLPRGQSFPLRREDTSPLTTTTCSTVFTSEAILALCPVFLVGYPAPSLCLEFNVPSAQVAICPGLPRAVSFLLVVPASHMASAYLPAQKCPIWTK